MKKIITFMLVFILAFLVGCSNKGEVDNKTEVKNDEINESNEIIKEETLPMSATVYNGEGELECYLAYIYDENNNMVKYGALTLQKEWDWYYLNTYDENGNQTESSQYNGSGEKLISFFYDIDEKGNIINRKIDNEADGVIDSTDSYEYQDDKIKKIVHENSNQFNIFEYDNNNNLISETLYNSIGDKKIRTWEYEYDKNGNNIKRSFVNPEGNVEDYAVLEYDDNNFCLTESSYDKDGKLTEKVCFSKEKIIDE